MDSHCIGLEVGEIEVHWGLYARRLRRMSRQRQHRKGHCFHGTGQSQNTIRSVKRRYKKSPLGCLIVSDVGLSFCSWNTLRFPVPAEMDTRSAKSEIIAPSLQRFPGTAKGSIGLRGSIKIFCHSASSAAKSLGQSALRRTKELASLTLSRVNHPCLLQAKHAEHEDWQNILIPPRMPQCDCSWDGRDDSPRVCAGSGDGDTFLCSLFLSTRTTMTTMRTMSSSPPTTAPTITGVQFLSFFSSVKAKVRVVQET